MMRLEVELVRRAAEGQHQAANIPINPELTLHKNIILGPGPGERQRPGQRFRTTAPATSAAPGGGPGRNIDSFITKNLDGLREIKSRNPAFSANSVPSNFLSHLACSTSPPAIHDTEAGQRKTFTISDSVREELMDKQKRALMAAKAASPPTPSRPRPKQSNTNNGNMSSAEDPLYLPMSDIHKPAPLKPPPPAPDRRVLRSMESSTTLCSSDSVYATVDKNKKRSASRSGSSGGSGENYYQSVDVTSGSQLKHLG